MRHILPFFLLCLLFSEALYAQQDKMFTQTLNYPSSLNPAYVGSANCTQFLALYRNQWQGIEDAPVSTVISGNTYLDLYRVGLGVTLEMDKVNFIRTKDIAIDASYRVPLSESRNINMAFGIKTTFTLTDLDISKVKANDEGDPKIVDIDNDVNTNFGVGMYVFSPKFYFGISSPRILREKTGSGGVSDQIFHDIHYYITGGLWLDVNPMIQLKPSVVVRMVKGVTPSFDMNLSAFFMEKIWVGGSYRLHDAVSAILQYQFNESLRVGYSYDITTSYLNTVSNGSHEISLRYDFLFSTKKIKSPRYF